MASQFATAGIRFSRVVLMVRGAEGVANAVNFYTNALSLHVIRHTDEFAELTCGVTGGGNSNSNSNSIGNMMESTASSSSSGRIDGGGHRDNDQLFRLSIKAVESEAQLTQGYSPILSFDVDDLDTVIAKCAQMGANLDGPIQYPAHGKIAALRSPDGHMIGLYEPSI